MEHYTRLQEIREELDRAEDDLVYYAGDPEAIEYAKATIISLKAEQKRLRDEEDLYREGYEAGIKFHLDGVPMQDEWLGRTGPWRRGFTQAGFDS